MLCPSALLFDAGCLRCSTDRRAPPPRNWAALLGAVLLALCAISPRAWDAEPMLRAAQAQGPAALAGARALQSMLAGLTGQGDEARLATVNRFVNEQIAYASDLEVWGVADHWASPLEAIGKGRGDCEDYVIAKYFALLASGMPASKLRLVYVRARLSAAEREPLAHMVLAYHEAAGSEPLILDNLIAEIRTASRRPDLEPVFSFNGEGFWQGVGGPSSGDPLARLSRWRDVLERAHASGFP